MPSVLQKSVALPERMTDCRPTPLYDTKMQITVPPPSHLEVAQSDRLSLYVNNPTQVECQTCSALKEYFEIVLT